MPLRDLDDRKTHHKRKAGDVFSGQGDASAKYHREGDTNNDASAYDREGDNTNSGVTVVEDETSTIPSPSKGGKYREGQMFRDSEGSEYEIGAPDKDNPNDDNNPYTLENLEDFELAGGGAGSKKGTARLSRSDLKKLYRQGGFSKQELIDYANSLETDGPGASGEGAQKLLAKWTSQLNADTDPESGNGGGGGSGGDTGDGGGTGGGSGGGGGGGNGGGSGGGGGSGSGSGGGNGGDTGGGGGSGGGGGAGAGGGVNNGIIDSNIGGNAGVAVGGGDAMGGGNETNQDNSRDTETKCW